jgi:hypothetical protein
LHNGCTTILLLLSKQCGVAKRDNKTFSAIEWFKYGKEDDNIAHYYMGVTTGIRGRGAAAIN